MPEPSFQHRIESPQKRRRPLGATRMLAMASLLATGCASTPKPGDISRVQPTSEMDRAGNAYLLRGWIGVFSTGIDQLGEQLNNLGVRTTVFQEDQWPDLAAELTREYGKKSPPNREPLVLIGHSYGADSVIRIAERLEKKGIVVDLIVTLDPVTPPKVPGNVKQVVNLYQSNGFMDNFPWLRGIPVQPAKGSAVTIKNVDIRRDRTDLLAKDLDHFNIEKQPLVHAEIVARVAEVCPPRGAGLAGGRAPTPVLPSPGAGTATTQRARQMRTQ